MKHPSPVAWLAVALLLCTVAPPAFANEPCCDDAYGYHRSGPLFLGMPVDLDGVEKTPGRYGLLVPMDGADTLFATCAKHGGLWVSGARKPVACNRVTKGATLAVLDVDPAALGGAGQGLALPIVFSTSAFTLIKPAIAGAMPIDVASVRALDPSLEPASIKTLSLGDDSNLLVMAGGPLVPDGNGEEDCATQPQALFVRDHGELRRAGEIPDMPSGVVMADTTYLVVPVDCGKRASIWKAGRRIEKVGYFDNGYEYGGD